MIIDIDLTPSPESIKLDSLKQAQEAAIELLKNDPNTFWNNVQESAIHFGMKVLAAIVIYIVGAWLIGRVKKIMERIFARKKTERTLASFISSFVSIMLTVLLVVITISTLGVDTTSFAALLAAGGMAIGMALSGTVQNFAGGIMILAFKPFKAGDFIEAGGHKGTVMDVSIVSTKILTPDNRVVILPNGSLSNGNIENYNAQQLRRVDLEVSVDYGVDADACIDAIKKLISEDTRVLTSADKRPLTQGPTSVNTNGIPIPDPFVALSRLNSNDISFVVRVWVLSAAYWDVYFDLQKKLYTELPKQGFTFAYPHCDVTIKKEA